MISIIIVVKNDEGVHDTLAKLMEIKKPIKTEIIVVDASHGNLDFIRKKFTEVTWIDYKSKKNKSTIPEQRNVGVKKSNGNIIVFIDANCIPSEYWLTELYHVYEKENEKIIAGPVIPKNKNTIVNINVPINDPRKYLKECATINVLIEKSVFEKIGLFDESLLFGEDVDFMWRATEAGYKIRFHNKALITHDWGSIKDEFLRSMKYGNARAHLLKKHTDKISAYFKNNFLEIIYVIYIIGLPISIIFPWYLGIIILLILNNLKQPQPVKLVFIRLLFAVGFIKGIVTNV